MKPLEISFNKHPSPDLTNLIPHAVMLQAVMLCTVVYDLQHPENAADYHSAQMFMFDREANEDDFGSVAWMADILKLKTKHLIDSVSVGLPQELLDMSKGGITDHTKAAKFIIKLRHYLLYGKTLPDDKMPI